MIKSLIRKVIPKLYLKDYILNSVGIIKWKYLDLCPLWRCNAKCPTCDSWKRNIPDMTPEQASQIIESPYFKDVSYGIIEGGEPTLWKLLPWFIQRFHETHPKSIIAIITNGLLPGKIENLLSTLIFNKVNTKNLRWVVSLNGIGETHDISRGVPGAYQKSLKTAMFLKKENQFVTFSFVPFAENEKDYEAVSRLGKELGIYVDVCYPCQSGKFDDGSKDRWTPVNRERLYEITKKKQKGRNFIDRWVYDYFWDHVTKKELMPCWGARSMIHINPMGVIRPCSMSEDMQIGQVLNDSIEIEREELLRCLKRIPDQCEYKTGDSCNQCYLAWTAKRSFPVLLKWRLRKCLNMQ